MDYVVGRSLCEDMCCITVSPGLSTFHTIRLHAYGCVLRMLDQRDCLSRQVDAEWWGGSKAVARSEGVNACVTAETDLPEDYRSDAIRESVQ